jgi:regulator of sigma E protease
LTFIIFTILFVVNGVPTPDTQIDQVFPNTPAATAGFQPGDVIVQLDGRPITRSDTETVRQIGEQNKGRSIEAVVERDGKQVTLHITPGPWTTSEGEHRDSGFGIAYAMEHVRISLPSALVLGVQRTILLLVSFLEGLKQLFGGLLGLNAPPSGGVAGVVGIARGTGEVIQREGLPGFWQWTAAISLNLFLINLLPIPALDGSHIVFSLIEMVRRGKKIPPEKEAMVHAIGFAMVLGLMLVITVSDVTKWINGTPVIGGG